MKFKKLQQCMHAKEHWDGKKEMNSNEVQRSCTKLNSSFNKCIFLYSAQHNLMYKLAPKLVCYQLQTSVLISKTCKPTVATYRSIYSPGSKAKKW